MSASPRILLRRERRKDPVQWRLHKSPTFIDPYPEIPGTLPEKMCFAELAKRHIPFTFQADWFVEVTSKLEPERRFALLGANNIVPDILLPIHKIVIEVQGEYWHSAPDQIEHDRMKFAIYRTFGYQVYPLFEADILRDVAGQIDKIPSLANGPTGAFKLGTQIGLGANSVAAANRARAKPKTPTLRRRVARGRRR